MKIKNDPQKDTPEQEIVPETTKEQTREHAWWESVKYPDPPYESDR